MSRQALWLVGMGVAIYATTMAFSATYNPYWADIALPATQDTLMMAVLLAYVVFFAEGAVWWMGLAEVLVFLSLPSGQVLVVFWVLATLVVGRRVSRPVTQSTAILILCLAAAAVIPRLLASIALPVPGGEYDLREFVRGFAYLQLTDWKRFLYVAVPSGILPVIGLFAWSRNDQIGKALILVTVGYFGLFYVQVHTSLHHFVPVMIFPLAIFWRAAMSSGHPRQVTLAVAASGVLALALSLPQNPQPHLVSREIGFAIEDRVSGYSRSAPEIFRSHDVLARLFPLDWDARVPDASFGGSPLTWIYYANHRPATTPPANYILQNSSEPAPPGMRLVASDQTGAIYVRSDSILAAHRGERPPSPAGSRVYSVPRNVLFGDGSHDQPGVISVKAAIEAVGIDPSFITGRGGIKR